MTFSNQKSPTKPAVEDGEAIIEEEEEVIRNDLDEVDGDVKSPHHLMMSAERDSGNCCHDECRYECNVHYTHNFLIIIKCKNMVK